MSKSCWLALGGKKEKSCPWALFYVFIFWDYFMFRFKGRLAYNTWLTCIRHRAVSTGAFLCVFVPSKKRYQIAVQKCMRAAVWCWSWPESMWESLLRLLVSGAELLILGIRPVMHHIFIWDSIPGCWLRPYRVKPWKQGLFGIRDLLACAVISTATDAGFVMNCR